MSESPLQPLFRIDPGWLFIAAGVAVIASTVLVAAENDLVEARAQRDRTLALETHRVARLDRYASYLDALDHGDESVALSLAANQLNVAPADRLFVVPPDRTDLPNASVFPALEPDPMVLPSAPAPRSLLARLALHERHRLWLLAGGALCVFIGLLPPSEARTRTSPRPPA